MISNSTNQYSPSLFFIEFQSGINIVSSKLTQADQLHLQLYYSNIVSLMEKYLYDLFVTEISKKGEAFNKLITLPKFSNQNFPLKLILNKDIRDVVIHSVKSMVWHRLNDLDPMFKNTLNIKIQISQALKKIIETRHHFVHRNGFNLTGQAVTVTNQELSNAIEILTEFVKDIDKKFSLYIHSI